MFVALIALLIFGTVILLFMGLRSAAPQISGVEALEARMDTLRRNSDIMEEEGDLSIPFSERILLPAMMGLTRFSTSLMPSSMMANVERQLVIAGSPMTISTFATMWVGCGVTFVVLAGFILIAGGSFGIQQIGMAGALVALGFWAPTMWLKGKVKARQKLVLKALPDALDLVTTSVEAGLGLDAALARVAEKTAGPLAAELSQALREIAMGRLRKDALTDMGERTGVEDLISFIMAVVQAEQLGVGIAQVLRIQSEQMRTRRRQRAEKAAHEAPIKMMFPLVFFIFPAFLVVIIGPGMIRIAETLG